LRRIFGWKVRDVLFRGGSGFARDQRLVSEVLNRAFLGLMEAGRMVLLVLGNLIPISVWG